MKLSYLIFIILLLSCSINNISQEKKFSKFNNIFPLRFSNIKIINEPNESFNKEIEKFIIENNMKNEQILNDYNKKFLKNEEKEIENHYNNNYLFKLDMTKIKQSYFYYIITDYLRYLDKKSIEKFKNYISELKEYRENVGNEENQKYEVLLNFEIPRTSLYPFYYWRVYDLNTYFKFELHDYDDNELKELAETFEQLNNYDLANSIIRNDYFNSKYKNLNGVDQKLLIIMVLIYFYIAALWIICYSYSLYQYNKFIRLYNIYGLISDIKYYFSTLFYQQIMLYNYYNVITREMFAIHYLSSSRKLSKNLIAMNILFYTPYVVTLSMNTLGQNIGTQFILTTYIMIFETIKELLINSVIKENLNYGKVKVIYMLYQKVELSYVDRRFSALKWDDYLLHATNSIYSVVNIVVTAVNTYFYASYINIVSSNNLGLNVIFYEGKYDKHGYAILNSENILENDEKDLTKRVHELKEILIDKLRKYVDHKEEQRKYKITKNKYKNINFFKQIYKKNKLLKSILN